MYTEKDRITLNLLCFTSNDSQKSMKILINLNTSNYFNIAVADEGSCIEILTFSRLP